MKRKKIKILSIILTIFSFTTFSTNAMKKQKGESISKKMVDGTDTGKLKLRINKLVKENDSSLKQCTKNELNEKEKELRQLVNEIEKIITNKKNYLKKLNSDFVKSSDKDFKRRLNSEKEKLNELIKKSKELNYEKGENNKKLAKMITNNKKSQKKHNDYNSISFLKLKKELKSKQEDLKNQISKNQEKIKNYFKKLNNENTKQKKESIKIVENEINSLEKTKKTLELKIEKVKYMVNNFFDYFLYEEKNKNSKETEAEAAFEDLKNIVGNLEISDYDKNKILYHIKIFVEKSLKLYKKIKFYKNNKKMLYGYKKLFDDLCEKEFSNILFYFFKKIDEDAIFLNYTLSDRSFIIYSDILGRIIKKIYDILKLSAVPFNLIEKEKKLLIEKEKKLFAPTQNEYAEEKLVNYIITHILLPELGLQGIIDGNENEEGNEEVQYLLTESDYL